MTIKSLLKTVPELPITIKKFSGGEVQVTIAKPDYFQWPDQITVCVHLKCADGIIALMQLKDALDQMSLYHNPSCSIDLVLPYIPYGRQDRAMVDGDAFSLRVFAKMLNAMNFASVTTSDPHSDVSTALIDRCLVYTQDEIAQDFVFARYDGLVSPDGGALKKIHKVAAALKTPYIIEGYKSRDVFTGKIIHTGYHGIATNKKLLIVDDLIDGGQTFIELAKCLKHGGAARVDLYVTHGIFAKGVEHLKEYIDHIYCAYGWSENVKRTDFVTPLELF